MFVLRCVSLLLTVCFVYDATSESTPFFRKDYIFNVDTQKFYKVHTTRVSWPEAVYRCKLEGATLLVPESKAEVDAVVKEVNVKMPAYPGVYRGYNTVWIGITDQISEGDYVAINGQPINEVYIDWADSEPDSYGGNQDCICLRATGKMNDSGCKEEGPFVCQKSRASLEWNNECELPDLSYRYNKNVKKCYKLHLTPKTWADAFAVCTAEDSYLAVINTVSEAEHLVRLFNEAPKPEVTTDRFNPSVALLGFHNLYENEWATVKGESMRAMGYSRWTEGQPTNAGNKRCGSMFLNGTLNILVCDETAIFACEHDLKSSNIDGHDKFDNLSSQNKGIMKATVESTPFFRKDYIFNADAQNFYKVHTIHKSWPKALHRCQLEGATLLVPESKAEVDAVVKEVNVKIPTFPGMPGGYNTVWIGITDHISEGYYVAVNGQPIDEVFMDWADGEPNNAGGHENCICLRVTGEMNDSGCKEDGAFVCKKPRASLEWNNICELPDLSYRYDKNIGKCYKLHLTPKTWADAFAVCTAEESYLAVINTVSEAEHLVRLFNEAPKPEVTTDRFNPSVALLGFHNLYENEWATVKGESMRAMGYSRWTEGQPTNAGNKRCGSMFLNGTLNILVCDETAIFACEHDLKSSNIDGHDKFDNLSSQNKGIMKATVESTPFFRKDYIFNADTQNFYKVHTIHKSWPKALHRCQLEGATLLVPESKAEVDAVVKEVNVKIPTFPGMPGGYNTVWIGITDQISEGYYVAVNGQPIDEVFMDWADGEPNNAGGHENCICLRVTGEMNDSGCKEDGAFVCKKPRASLEWNNICELPDLSYRYDKNIGKCYKLHLTPKTWADAFAVCTAEESYLAVINTVSEAEHLVRLFNEAPKPDVTTDRFNPSVALLGFHNQHDNGWATVKGDLMRGVSYSRWAEGQPNNAGNKRCGSMFLNGTLNVLDCDEAAIFACEHDLKSSIIGGHDKFNDLPSQNTDIATSESRPIFRKDYIYNADTQNFYKVHTTRVSWPEAVYRCKLEGATLLVPESKVEVDAVVNEVNKKMPAYPGMYRGYNTVWIGITDQFSEGYYVAINGQPINEVYIDWADSEPDSYGGNQDCICLRATGKMNDSGCKEEGPFVCKKSRATLDWNYVCELPDLSYRYDKNVEKCYKLHLTPKTWADAFAVCTAEESYLAVINTVSEAEHLVRLFNEAPKPDVTTDRFNPSVALLGFHNQYENGWATVKGESMRGVGYSRWAAGQPNNAGNKRCGSMFLNGTLNVLDCDEAAIFACEHDLKSSNIGGHDKFNDLSWSSL